MVRGGQYRVINTFVDAYGHSHAVGEHWEFIATMFSKFDDELTLCVRTSDGKEWTISLRWLPGLQEKIIEHFSEYVTIVSKA